MSIILTSDLLPFITATKDMRLRTQNLKVARVIKNSRSTGLKTTNEIFRTGNLVVYVAFL